MAAVILTLCRFLFFGLYLDARLYNELLRRADFINDEMVEQNEVIHNHTSLV